MTDHKTTCPQKDCKLENRIQESLKDEKMEGDNQLRYATTPHSSQDVDICGY